MNGVSTVLQISEVSKSFGGHRVVNGLTLSLSSGTIGCLLGPSGCGKTTMLRIIAGFERIESGEVRINGQAVATAAHQVPAETRRVGMVFQDYALFPHLSVADNVAFGLSDRSRQTVNMRVREMLDLVHLAAAGDRFPHELSGGQQQRVALARALAPRPDLLLLDEPFSNLDVTLRERLSMEVRHILKNFGITALMVTHNQNEAFAMADEIGVMWDGKLIQWDTAYGLYHRPVSPDVADFVGEGVLLPGRVVCNGRVETGLGVLEGDFSKACRKGACVEVLIRPEDIIHDDSSPFSADIESMQFRGPNILYTLMLDSGDRIQVLVPSHHKHLPGGRLGILPKVDDLVLFERCLN